ncbi:MAG TPA: hypothetical protein PKG54_01800 [Phycisphaerae bacterium]|jgi:hypothetical protein|nr:hypothetical protein [Phycisphaerae bacterium]HOB73235.1 hypothetical protein [Phycisphaerae bacterium]HOJ54869.1 hypothetical protein [Phycisphaerae bacterium]HOL26055.1 hypothetical protein [Phycisphaerae bacterium]HPP21509.1 hypothetical protein [Phycisphaerae bacterium]
MRKRRVLIALLVFIAVAVSLGATLGYGAYHRSELYRRRTEERLTRFFNLPTDIGRIRPLEFTSQELSQVQVWLPDRRERIFHCRRAVWDTAGAANGTAALVSIESPVLSIGSEAWRKEDYLRVIREGLAHNYRDMNIDEIRLSEASIIWPRKDFRLLAEDVDGSILYDDQGRGDATLTCRKLNGTPVREPIQILARIDPHEDEFIPEVTLVVPTLPLQALGLDELLGGTVTQGSFTGRITVHQEPFGDRVRLSGSAASVHLEELTRRLPWGPVPAVIDLTIDEILLFEQDLERLAFRGELRQLQPGSLLAGLGLEDLGGEARLTVRDARLTGNGLEHLAFSGEWLGADANSFIRQVLGKGGIRGRLFVHVHNLEIRDNRLVAADAAIQVLPPRHGPATVDRTLLLELIKEKAGLSLPERLLPESVEFTQMSARLLSDGRRLRILNSAGQGGPPVITAKVLGRELPLLADLDESIDLEPLQERLRERISEWRLDVRERIRARTSAGRAGQ